MTSQRRTGGDAISGALVDLAADRGLPPGLSVTPDLVELAQRHGLLGLLHRETDAPLARAAYSRIDTRRRVMLSHLSRILERLDESGIRAAVLKGPRVALQYRDPGVRSFGDLDIMVEEGSLDRALEVLDTDEAAAGIPERGPKAAKRDVYFRDRAGVSFNVDLHWDLFGYSQLRGAASGATPEAWRAASPERESPLGPHWVLPQATEICFLATHAILDHRFRLILFRDFAEIAQGNVAWEEVVDTAERWGLRTSAYIPLWLARRSIDAAVPEDVLTSLRTPSLVVSYLERVLPRVDLVRFDGHTVHPLNLATVLLGDTLGHRLVLTARAPRAFPAWRRKVIARRPSPNSPRVLIVVSTDQRRGAEVFAERLTKGLVERGWLADAVSLTTMGSATRAIVNPLTDIGPGEAGRLKPQIVMALRERIRSLDADVVLAIGPALRYGVLANLGLKSRLFYVAIGEPGYWLRSRRSTMFNRMLLRRVDRVLAVADRTKEQLIALEPKIADNIEVTYTGVPDALFLVDGSGSDDAGLRVVMVGSLSAEKDPGLALRAVARVDGARLRFVGAGPLEESLREEAEQLGVQDRVEFAGSVDDVAPDLAWADVLILTSRTEGLPGAILEAGAAGVPAVAVDVGGVSEAIRHGDTGIVVAHSDHEGLVEALRGLADDPRRLIRMGTAARAHVRKRFSMETTVSRYAEALAKSMR